MRRTDERGIAHILEIIIISVIVIGVAGLIAWRMWGSGQPNNTANSPAQQAIANAACTGLNDSDLCKFFTSFKAQKYSTVNATNTADGKTTSSLYQTDGTNYHMKLTGDMSYETISIGQDLYVLNGGTWWKQTVPKEDATKFNVSTDSNVDFTQPDTKATTPQPTYKKIGTEACGNLTCFKYQIVDPSNPGDTQYVWFDNKDYQLRRYQTTSSDGSKSDASFDYAKVTITAPTPSQTLAPNQYILPGQSEPVTLPSQTDLQSMLNAAGQ